VRHAEHGSPGRPLGRPNSVGLTSKQLDAVMLRMEGGGGGKPDRRRKFVRWSFRQASLDLHVIQPGGSAGTCRVACRNLSCGGMSVVHSAFVYPGSPCIAYLPRPKGGLSQVTGTIVRCVHVQGMVHELGIRFNTSIDAGEFVDNDPMAGQFSLEVVEPELLTGTLLYVESSRLDQKLIQHYLRGTNVRLRIAEDAAQAAEVLREGCDIVVCDFHLADNAARAVVAQVREALPNVPIIMVTSDSSPQTAAKIRGMPVHAFLAKPFTDAMLHRALGEFLIARKDRDTSARDSSLPGGVAADLSKDLVEFQNRLETTITADDPTGCYVVCQQIGATAQSLRIRDLSHIAQEASDSLAKTMSIKGSEKLIRELIAACGKRAAA
jgi:CheY-like chemotaxis protein